MQKYLFSAIIVILSVSIFLNLNYNFNNRTLQARIDFMSGTAFQSWLDLMRRINSNLKSAKTNIDVKEAMNDTAQANELAAVLEAQIEIARPPDFADHLYLRMSDASFAMDKAIFAVAEKPPATEQVLSPENLQKIGNITTAIENLEETVGTVKQDLSPVQQLEEKGILDLVIDYLEQIRNASLDIWTSYGLYGS